MVKFNMNYSSPDSLKTLDTFNSISLSIDRKQFDQTRVEAGVDADRIASQIAGKIQSIFNNIGKQEVMMAEISGFPSILDLDTTRRIEEGKGTFNWIFNSREQSLKVIPLISQKLQLLGISPATLSIRQYIERDPSNPSGATIWQYFIKKYS